MIASRAAGITVEKAFENQGKPSIPRVKRKAQRAVKIKAELAGPDPVGLIGLWRPISAEGDNS